MSTSKCKSTKYLVSFFRNDTIIYSHLFFTTKIHNFYFSSNKKPRVICNYDEDLIDKSGNKYIFLVFSLCWKRGRNTFGNELLWITMSYYCWLYKIHSFSWILLETSSCSIELAEKSTSLRSSGKPMPAAAAVATCHEEGEACKVGVWGLVWIGVWATWSSGTCPYPWQKD